MAKHVPLGHGRGGAAQPRRLLRYPAAQFDEQAPLDLRDALVGSQDLALVFLELRRGEAFGIHQRLLALEIGGRQVQIGLRYLEIEAKDLVVTNLERADAGALAFPILHGGDDLSAVLAQVAQLVKLGRQTRGG